MINSLREKYNRLFTEETYKAFLDELENLYPGQLDFRIGETAVFVPASFAEKMFSACESIIDVITSPEYKKQSERAIPSHLKVPNEDDHPQFIAFDFGVCQTGEGELEPQLIEMQAFPTLFAWHVYYPEIHQKHFWTPENFSCYLNDFNNEAYTSLLKKIIIADTQPENVVLLEVNPHEQKTRVDFYATKTLLGINVVNLTDVIQDGKNLFYEHDGRKVKIDRIYNRVIFDDLFQQSKEIQEKGKIFQQQLNVTWVPHPNWFYRISKFSLPFINHAFVPETHFLSELKTIPVDIENYVVKPLFSFAGQGVIIDVTKDEINGITDPENWIIQRKVPYAAAIKTPDGGAKAEIRLFYFWEPGKERPVATNNLARLSKGKMIGVRYNKHKNWVGASYGLFEK